MFYFDPLYFIIIGPGFILSLWASFKVKRTFSKYQKSAISSQASGAEVARELLQRSSINGVLVKEHQGMLSDHYDPIKRVVNLSPEVYQGRSISAVGVAAHEVGHAIQDHQGYFFMRIRQVLVGPANLGSNLSYIVILLGFLFHVSGLIWLGIFLFSAIVLFQIVTLPVELDASRRAKLQLIQTGIVSQQEGKHVAKVLNAAAMTYIAAVITSLLTLVYYVMRADRD
jgi:Zn-dependent membrane protease YugP